MIVTFEILNLLYWLWGGIFYTDLQSSLDPKKDGSDKVGLSPNATAYAPSRGSSKSQENTGSPTEVSEDPLSGRPQGETQSVNSRGQPGSSTSSTSDRVGAAPGSTGPGLSPSSSMGSLSSEKSALNPHAKVGYILSLMCLSFEVHKY